MSRLRAVAAVLTLGMPFVATAADITRVASSFEDDDPFGLFIDANVEYGQHNAKILREVGAAAPDGSAPTPLGNARSYASYETVINVDLAAGISRDVELSFGLPVVLFRNEYWTPPESNGIDLSGVPLREQAFRQGLGNARFGLGWAIFNQKKDDTKPTWVARFNYEAPTAPVLNPSIDTSNNKNPATPVGDRVHKYTLSTALSRRIGLAEPYFKVFYTIPVRGPGAYSNCDTRLNLGTPDSCGQYGWSRKETGIQAPHTVGVVMGTEIQVGGRAARMLKLDVRAMGNFVSSGRYYNELSGALGKLLTSSEYLQLGGQLGASFLLNDVISVRASGTFLHSTDHVLTAESRGRGATGDGTADSLEDRNPNFNDNWDLSSRRFYASESRELRVNATVVFQF
jgi:hypothetical protein